MSNPPPHVPYAAVANPDVDAGHLSALAICHYIWAALLAVFACFGLLYVALGIFALSGHFNAVPPPAGGTTGGPPAGPPDAWFGYFFIAFGAVILVAGWALAACTFLAGRGLARRRRRSFAIVVAALNCLMFPIGTALGVFTLIVLIRESVRRTFEGETSVAPT